MLNLFVFREKLRACYARFGNIIVPVLHFSTALLALVLLNNGMGYERRLRAPIVVTIGPEVGSVSREPREAMSSIVPIVAGVSPRSSRTSGRRESQAEVPKPRQT